jgi:hypothetical protein
MKDSQNAIKAVKILAVKMGGLDGNRGLNPLHQIELLCVPKRTNLLYVKNRPGGRFSAVI